MSATQFKDHFSGHAADYTQYRPTYPRALFEWLAAQAPQRERAWDCATGNGQAAQALAEFFAQVIATDASAKQIAAAQPHERIHYAVAPAEYSGIEAHSIDLITVAQALHWFDFEAFYAEARRVLRPAGLLAVWSYGLMQIESEVDALVYRLYQEIVGPYWPAERHYVEAGYRTLPFPLQEVAAPSLAMSAQWNLAQLIGYLGTWSAVQRYRQQQGSDPLAQIAAPLAAAWGDAATVRAVSWPLYLRAGRFSA